MHNGVVVVSNSECQTSGHSSFPGRGEYKFTF